MAPLSDTSRNSLNDTSTITKEIDYENYDTHLKLPAEIGTDYNFKRKIVWFNALGFLALHLAALFGILLVPFCRILTLLWALFTGISCGLSVTLGAHRMYSHKCFKGTWPLKFILMVFQTIAGQNCMYIWVRDHRQHHKYSDTDADPHNSNRGFFFSHIGWLMSKKHPAVISKGKTIDMSDLESDPFIMFQKRYYKPLYVIFAFLLPTVIPIYFWNESYINSLFVSYFLRYMGSLNGTWLINSAAHLYGTRPYDKSLKPVEGYYYIGALTLGEGWHNYHHAFPWDYRAAELGTHNSFTTFVIDMCASLGLAYDLRTTPYSMIEYRSLLKGDGTHEIFNKEAQAKSSKIRYQQTPRKEKIQEKGTPQIGSRSITVKG